MNLFENAEATFKDCLETMKKKNSDYSPGEDFKNFESVLEMNITDPEIGILVRMQDKWMRIINLINKQRSGKERAVMDEKLEDTIKDFINYLAILKAYLDKKEEKQ